MLEQVNAASTKLSELHGHSKKVPNHQCKHCHRMSKHHPCSQPRSSLRVQRSPSGAGQKPPLNTQTSVPCSAHGGDKAGASPWCCWRLAGGLGWLWEEAAGKEKGAEQIIDAKNVNKLPDHPSQGLSAFQEKQFDVFVWLGLQHRCCSPCQPSATLLLVLQAHMAKRTCSHTTDCLLPSFLREKL